MYCTLSCRGLSFNLEFSLKARCTPCSLYLLDFVFNSCGVFPTTEAYPAIFISAGLCPQMVYSTLQRDILYLEFVWAVYEEAFSVNFIVDRFSLPYRFIICLCFFMGMLFL